MSRLTNIKASGGTVDADRPRAVLELASMTYKVAAATRELVCTWRKDLDGRVVDEKVRAGPYQLERVEVLA